MSRQGKYSEAAQRVKASYINLRASLAYNLSEIHSVVWDWRHADCFLLLNLIDERQRLLQYSRCLSVCLHEVAEGSICLEGLVESQAEHTSLNTQLTPKQSSKLTSDNDPNSQIIQFITQMQHDVLLVINLLLTRLKSKQSRCMHCRGAVICRKHLVSLSSSLQYFLLYFSLMLVTSWSVCPHSKSAVVPFQLLERLRIPNRDDSREVTFIQPDTAATHEIRKISQV